MEALNQSQPADLSASEAPSTEPQSTPTPEPTTPSGDSTYNGGESIQPEGEQGVAPAFNPNLKYKVLDQEKEIPSYFKDVIKDADTEKKVRELFEKADGLDIVKPKYQEVRQQFRQVSEQFQGLQSQIQDLRTDYQRGDFDSFFKKLSIPEEKVLNWMVEKIRYNQLPAEQRQMIDERRTAQEQARYQERNLTSQQQAYMQQLASAKAELLDLSLERGEVKGFADQFDSRFGKAGAFREAVINVGQAAWDRGVDLSPQQAIKQIMDHYGKLIGGSSPAPAPQVGGQANPPVIPAKGQETSVIPNVAGRQTSATASRPKSIEDLKKLAERMSS